MADIDDLMRRGQDQLRVLMGGRGNGTGAPSGPSGPGVGKGALGLIALALVALWLFASLYTVRPEERSVELFLGEFSSVGDPGLNFAPWPLVTAEVVSVTRERSVTIGVRDGNSNMQSGLMLTTDENIVDIDFEVVWNINDPAKFLFNLAEPDQTITAVSEAAMREVISASELAPILNRDRDLIADTVMTLIQETLDQYDSGINIVRLNLDRADPPEEVIDAFRDVQAAEQQRERLTREADAYANQVLAAARGDAAQALEQSEGYRARVVNEAEGEASRFSAILEEYRKAPEVTRKRLYLETMERVFSGVNKVIIDGEAGEGVVPYLPLDQLRGGVGRTTTGQQQQSGGN
ncbi:membrane protease subunit HflK [Pacificitalea manganoxidans]|nr:membrane protease subunit HflK [Pacificitalea manganoxidans]